MNLKFFIPFLFLIISSSINAQTTIINELMKPGKGTIIINSDSQINALIGKANFSNDPFIKIPGYRIQAFSGNQSQSKDEAMNKAREVKETFPETATYVTYNAPIWRLRIGDFQSNQEAKAFMRDLKKKCPSIGKEMYIVTDEIKIAL